MKIGNIFSKLYLWIQSLFTTRYKVVVSYNSTYGDADDQTFIVKKFYHKQEKYISFKTETNETIEIRGAEGLNYRITEL